MPGGVAQALRFLREELAGAGIEDAHREALLIMAHVLGTEPAGVLPGDGDLDPGQRELIAALLERRLRRFPLPYLLGWVGFLDFVLCVRPGVFIPRPETEGLAERAVALTRSLPPRSLVLDLCTGSGALAIAIARARGDVRVVAVDISERSLRCAWENAHRLGVADRVELRVSDLFRRVPERFALIVANPPYVASDEIPRLPPEVSRHEPRAALDGGRGGMEVLRRILRGAPAHLVHGGWILCEIGDGQGENLVRFAEEVTNWLELRVEKDLGGRERYLVGRWWGPTI
ncbi:MAG: peptide chain release factor N(5)-glutamine methyltransferase [Caldiserica bacterium]|nr:peptide chain release factor N(5)-glutamine methyltransferase [Caldisericota bacterium]